MASKMKRVLAVLTAALLLTPGWLEGQQRPAKLNQKAGRPYPTRLTTGPPPSLTAPTVVPHAIFPPVTESEPNNNSATATAVTVGDNISGVITPIGDIDFFKFTADAGLTVDIDVDAAIQGSPLDSFLRLLGADGVTVIRENDDDFLSFDSRIRVVLPFTGDYFVSIADLFGRGGTNFNYSMTIDIIPPPDVTESEPNNASGTADAVAVGDVVGGVVDPVSDIDYFAFTAPLGTIIQLSVTASVVGSELDAVLQLYDTDGVTLLAENDDFQFSTDSRIRSVLPDAGQYFVAIRDFGDRGGPSFTYTIAVEALAPLPGDPTTLFAADFEGPGDLVFDSVGNMFVAEFIGTVTRVATDTTASTFFSSSAGAFSVEFSAFGELLVSLGDGRVVAVAPDGSVSTWASGLIFPFSLARDADGSVWLSDPGDGTIRRFDPYGGLLETVGDGFQFASHMAISPSGELHWTDGIGSILRLVAGVPQFVVQNLTGCCLEGLAFDVDGNMYVANGFEGHVLLFDAGGTLLDTLAFTNIGGPTALAFGRASDGSTTRRLYAANLGFNLSPPFVGAVVQLNEAGIRADGFLVASPTLIGLPRTSVRPGVMGAAYADTLVATGTVATPTWSLVGGALPAGVTFATASGIVSGLPEETGAFSFVVQADDGTRTGVRTYTLDVTAPVLVRNDVADAVLGVAGLLTADEIRYLDLLGNRNGSLDIGDLRAYVLEGNDQ